MSMLDVLVVCYHNKCVMPNKGGKIMSKENALRFMLLTEEDQALRDKCNGATDRCAGWVLTEEERERVIREEIMPAAKSVGCEFSLEEFLEALPGSRPLADDELDKAVGGRGQYTHTYRFPTSSHSITYVCEKAPNDTAFLRAFNGGGCPWFERYCDFEGFPRCSLCKHLHSV